MTTRPGILESAAPSRGEFARSLHDVELLIPYDEGGRLAELHEIAGDLEREETPQGVRVSARVPGTVAARYARYAAGAPKS